jgi:hypothetical protein
MLQLLPIIWQITYFTTLQTWEIWLRGFCIGFFIFGLVIIAVVLFTMGLGGHDTGHDIDHDGDLSIDKDVPIAKYVSIDKDL